MKLSTKTRATTLSVALAGTLALSACGASNESDSGTESGGESSDIEVTGALAGAGASSQQSAMEAWQAGFEGEWQEEALQLGGGEGDGGPIEQPAQPFRPGPPGQRLDRAAQLLGVGQLQVVRLVDRGFQLTVGQIAAGLAVLLEEDAAPLRARLLPRVRDLVQDGLLRLP